MKRIYYYETIIGTIGIADENYAITNLYFGERAEHQGICIEESALIKEAVHQLIDYFSGKRKIFDLPLAPKGTDFQKKVWAVLCTIPYGETMSYGEVAETIGNPKAARAVGMANNKNPIPIFIPCHRVIGANGKLIGYASGLHIKESLLNLERNYKYYQK